MDFLDKVSLKLQAGKGGNGIVAFITEKYRPKGGPGGGDGGFGGSIIFEADEGLSTLLHLRYNKILRAEDGGDGANKNQHGRAAKDTIIKVPLGTIVREGPQIIADFKNHGQKIVMAKGGVGGKGNSRFASSKNSAPKICENGALGEIKELVLEMMILADVGLVGFPSVGKSTIISVISNAKPEIADYPFTTLTPKIGMVKVNDKESFVAADLPGLIKGASQGKGLGIQFLKHIKRCKVLVHVIDVSSLNYRDVVQDYKDILNELKEFDSTLLERRSIVIANKMDDEMAQKNLNQFKKAYPGLEIYEVIALSNKGLKKVIYRLNDLLKIAKNQSIKEKVPVSFGSFTYTFDKKPDVIIQNKGNGRWIVTGEAIAKALQRNPLNTDQNQRRFQKLLHQLEVEKKLINAGAKNKDSVMIDGMELELIL